MAISPASAANYDWFLDTLCRRDQAAAEAAGRSVHALLAAEIDAALAKPSTVLFHPYLFGSPHGPVASAGFLGLRGWHDRGTLLRAVLEGIAFNHRVHVDALRDGFAVARGAADRRRLAQPGLRADVRRRPRACRSPSPTPTRPPPGARRSAPAPASASIASPQRRPARPRAARHDLRPRSGPQRRLRRRATALLCRIAETMAPLWPEIDAPGREPAERHERRLRGRRRHPRRRRQRRRPVPRPLRAGRALPDRRQGRLRLRHQRRAVAADPRRAEVPRDRRVRPRRPVDARAQPPAEERAALRRRRCRPSSRSSPGPAASGAALRTHGRARRRAPRSRGALLVKVGLALYDFYGSRQPGACRATGWSAGAGRCASCRR